MAGTEIDELSLKISVQGATPTQTKNINAFAQSLEKLDKALPTSLIQKLDKLSKLCCLKIHANLILNQNFSMFFP